MNSRNDWSVEPEISTALELDRRTLLDTIEKAWPQIAPIQGARLRDAVRSLPESEWNGRARILLALAASYRSVGSTSRSAALPWFRAANKIIAADPHSALDLRGGYFVQFAATLRSLGDLQTATQHLEAVRTMLEQDSSLEISRRIDLSASFSLQLGLVRIHLGSYDEALFALSLAEGLADEHLTTAERVECHSALAFVSFLLGDYSAADRHADLAEQHAEGTELLRSPFGALAQITRFHLLVERDGGNRDGNQSPIDDQLRDLRMAALNSDWEAQAIFAEAVGRFAAGAAIESLDLLGRVTRLIAGFRGDLALSTDIGILRAESLRRLGEVDESRRTTAALVPGQHHVTCPARVLALGHFTVGDPQAALDALDACHDIGDLHSMRPMAQILAITAAAHEDLGNTVASSIAFDRALLSAATNGTTWPFRSLPGEVIAALLARASTRIQPSAVRALIERLHVSPQPEAHPLSDPLSERELVIVRHLATGATLSQIGTELFISVNTVKSHVRSIYRKLAATNRREAIARALELGLTDD